MTATYQGGIMYTELKLNIKERTLRGLYDFCEKRGLQLERVITGYMDFLLEGENVLDNRSAPVYVNPGTLDAVKNDRMALAIEREFRELLEGELVESESG
jgi:hypothetical protein